MDAHRVDPVEEILPERAFLHLLAQIHIRGADKADVHIAWLGVADPRDRPVLENPQKLRLKVKRNVPDLVQKQGSALGQLDLSGLVGIGVRERSLDVSEELALEKGLRNRSGIHADHRAVPPLGMIVYLSGQKILTRSVLAGDQYRGIGRADLLDCLLDFGHSL